MLNTLDSHMSALMLEAATGSSCNAASKVVQLTVNEMVAKAMEKLAEEYGQEDGRLVLLTLTDMIGTAVSRLPR